MISLRCLTNFSKRSILLKSFQTSALVKSPLTIKVQELKLKEYGDLETSIYLHEHDLTIKDVSKGEIVVKLLGSPINPADINIIQGKYALLPKTLPAIIGNEGVFEVIDNNGSNKFKNGDWVLPKSGFGSWRSHAIENENRFIRIPNSLDKHLAASLSVNPCTAYRMLNDFQKLNPGDTIIQNGANSGVGQSVIQFSKQMNVNVINIVRKRDNLNELITYLQSIGAKYIITEEELRKPAVIDELFKQIPKPKLAFNCVGGKATSDMIRLLDHNSIMITYGGMSRAPLTLNTADFIFKNFKCVGFWLTHWKLSHNDDDFEKMINDVLKLTENINFKAQIFHEYKLIDYKEALKNTQSKYLSKKSLFVI